MTLQYIIVLIVVAVCVSYVGYRLYRTMTDHKSACDGCALKESCTKQNTKDRKSPKGCNQKS